MTTPDAPTPPPANGRIGYPPAGSPYQQNHNQTGPGAYGPPTPPPAQYSSGQFPPSQYGPSTPAPRPKGLALAALIVGLVAFVTGWVPVLGFILGAAALALGIVALVKKQSKIFAIIGTVLGTLALITSLITTASFGAFMAAGDGQSSSESRATPDEDTAPSTEEEAPEEEPAEEPTEEPAEPDVVEPPAAPDLSTFKQLDDRSFALIAKDPDAHIGETILVYGSVMQFDSATGRCNMLVSAEGTQKEMSYDYAQNTFATAGDGESDCPAFDPIVEGDHVKMWVTILGSYSYDTQIGGNTTVPAYDVAQVELLPAQEY
jgi:hypothetical protein